MKKLLFLAALAALAVVSCKENPTVDPTGGVAVGAENLVAYFPLDSQDAAITKGEGITVAELGGSGAFSEAGARGGCYVNTSANHETLPSLSELSSIILNSSGVGMRQLSRPKRLCAFS